MIQLDKMVQYAYDPMIKQMSKDQWGQCENEIQDEY